MMERTGQVMWVPEHLDDLDADFRAFYGIDGIGDGDFGNLSAPRFLALASRTFAYEGVMAARAMDETAQGETPYPSGVGQKEVQLEQLMLTPAAQVLGETVKV